MGSTNGINRQVGKGKGLSRWIAPALMILLGLAAQGTVTPPSQVGFLATSEAEAAAPATRARASEAYGRLPLRFEANRGQTDPRVKFLSRGSGYSLFLTPTEAVLSLREGSSGMGLIPEKALFRSQIPNPKGPSVNHLVGAPTVSLDSMTSDRGNCINYPPYPPFVRGGWGGSSLKMEIPIQSSFFTVKMPKSIEGPFLCPGAANFAWPCRFRTDPKSSMGTVLRMHLLGANPAPQVEGLDPLPGRTHYFIGNDPEKWRPNLPAYGRVQYKAIYPGIDLVFYGNQRELEYDLVVAPGADPKAIRLAFKGADKLSLDDQGNLILHTAGGELRQYAPVVYQEVDGARRKIPGRYVLQGQEQVGFEVAAHDPARPLVIDPALVYSTYLGGSSGEGGQDIAVDAEGNAYVTGTTSSTDFPSDPGPLAGDSDVFVAKLNPAGSALLYATYLGGSGGIGGIDFGNGIAVDTSGNAYVTGVTQANDFPTTLGAFQRAFGGGNSDAFVAKLSPEGTLVYATYLGGRENDPGLGIAVDSFGNAYVTGGTFKDPDFPADFPTQNPLQAFGGGFEDAFVAKLNPEGSALVYSTFLGGSSSEFGTGIAVDTSRNAYVTGVTLSSDFPTSGAIDSTCGTDGNCNPDPFSNPRSDAFVAKVNAEGSALVYSTYLGGSGTDGGGGDVGGGIAVDTSGNAYVTGHTDSANFPTQNPLQPTLGGDTDAFVAKVNTAGSTLVYSTYLGGSGGDQGEDIAVDGSGNAYVTGFTSSTNFPIANPLQPTHRGGFLDAFVTKLDAAGSALVYSTYLGGSGPVEGNRGRDQGHGIAVDNSGNAYVAGDTNSTDFPTQNPFQPALGGGVGFDAFIAKIEDVGPTEPVISVDPTELDFGNVSVGSSDDQGILVQNIGGGTLTGNASTNAPFSVDSGGSYSLAGGPPGQTVTVRFSPTSVGPFTGNVVFTGGEGATVTVTGRGVAHDLAVTKITAPKVITLTAKKPEQTRLVRVQIQNRSPHSETIQEGMLETLVNLEVESVVSDPPCPDPLPELHVGRPQKALPLALKSKQTLEVVFDVTFTLDCANDPAISTRKDPGHEDYRYTATVDHAALDGEEEDSHPDDDTCPRSVIPPFALDPYPDGKIKDKGCGALKPDKTLGDPVLTDVVVK